MKQTIKDLCYELKGLEENLQNKKHPFADLVFADGETAIQIWMKQKRLTQQALLRYRSSK